MSSISGIVIAVSSSAAPRWFRSLLTWSDHLLVEVPSFCCIRSAPRARCRSRSPVRKRTGSTLSPPGFRSSPRRAPRSAGRSRRSWPPSRRRLIATTTASTPPAMAVKRNALTTMRGSDDGADGGHQLDVPRSRRAERVTRQHQDESERRSRRPTRPGRSRSTPAAASPTPVAAIAAVSAFGNAPDPDVDDCRHQRARRERGERGARNCWQSPARTRC